MLTTTSLYIIYISLPIAPAPQPYYVSYVDKINQWWPGAAIAEGIGASNSKGCNIINLSFWTPKPDGTSAPVDIARAWSDAITYFGKGSAYGNTTKAIQANLSCSYHQQNAKVMVSAFGATSNPTSSNIDATAVGKNLAMFVIENQLDGVDLDYEDSAAMELGTGVPWLITMTKSLLRTFKVNAPGQKFYISHAPQAPYFMKGKYPQNYIDFFNSSLENGTVGDHIDFLNIQFYNQGTSDYLTYETLFFNADGWATETALLQIVQNGIPLEKMVVGKPVSRGDVSNTGFVDQGTLASIFKTARQGAWADCSRIGGVMNWQFASDTTAWMKDMEAAINC